MSTQFSVIRFVPDVIANESINVGVIAMSGQDVKIQFINSWHRARALGGEKAAYLRDFVKDMSARQETLFGRGDTWSEASIKEYLGRWRHMVECTELRGSIKPIDQLLPELVSLYLKDARAARAKVLTKKTASAAMFSAVSMAVQEKFGSDGQELVKRNLVVPGDIDQHECDVVLLNGQLYGAALGLSFRVADTPYLKTEVDAVAFAIEDMRAANKRLPIAISYVPPVRSSANFNRAKRILTSVGAEFIDYRHTQDWANRATKKIPKSAVSH